MRTATKGNQEEEEYDEDDFGSKKEGPSSNNNNPNSKDGKNNDKASAIRSKHSVTEQRRRSKINERFQILRDLIPHSDQKRDTASFLVEVIEYVQVLQEKVQKYEGSYQGWSPEPTKLMPWRNSHWRVQSYIGSPQGIKNGSGPGSNFPGKFDENSISINPTMLPSTQNPVESDPSRDVPCKAMDRHPEIANKGIPLPMPLQASMSAPMRSDGVLAHSLQGPVSDAQSMQCPCTSDTINQQEELMIEGGHNMPSTTALAQPRLVTQSLTKSMFNSPGLSLALQTNTNIDGQGDHHHHHHQVTRMGENFETNVGRRSREEEHESRSGSDNMDGGSGDDQDAADNPPRKKRYHRHTPQQIQELEALFKECPHPDEKQRLELSRRLCLETRQVKFWFQNRRTQMKTQLERHENSLLRQENDKLRAENMSIRDAMRNPICSNCGGPAIIGEISLEEQHLRIENARLKDELERVCALAGKFLGRPISSLATSIAPPLPSSTLELGVGTNGFGNLSTVATTMPLGPDYGSGGGISGSLTVVPPLQQPPTTTRQAASVLDRSMERSMFLELALAAMDELVKMAQTDEPLWMRSLEGGREILNREEYLRTFSPCIGLKPNGFVSETSRETGVVIINSLALVETLMDSHRWAEMFPCVIARTSTTDVISSGMGGTRNGALQLMHAELQVLSPLVPVREVNFLRFCKQHAEGVWAVVDVSIDTIRETSGAPPSFLHCRRLPSGCVVQDMPNGYSKVTWVEHAEYDESLVHQLYRPLLSSGMGFGAQRWVATLQRQCECLAILMSSTVPARDHTAAAAAITASGRRSMLKLAQRMTDNFCAGVCASTVHKWTKLNAGNVDEDVRVMTRKSVDDPGEPPGIVLSAATSVWLPVSPQRLFDFLRDERLRSEWDILSNGGPMQEMAHIAKGQDPGNCVSLLRASAMNANQSSMLILQETCIDAAGSLVVYAPVDIPAMHIVMNGGDSAYVALLPSGFAIVPDGPGSRGPMATTTSNGNNASSNGGDGPHRVSGSLLTVAFQILVNSLPTAKLTVESVETVNNLISCTVQKIKAALHCES